MHAYSSQIVPLSFAACLLALDFPKMLSFQLSHCCAEIDSGISVIFSVFFFLLTEGWQHHSLPW